MISAELVEYINDLLRLLFIIFFVSSTIVHPVTLFINSCLGAPVFTVENFYFMIFYACL